MQSHQGEFADAAAEEPFGGGSKGHETKYLIGRGTPKEEERDLFVSSSRFRDKFVGKSRMTFWYQTNQGNAQKLHYVLLNYKGLEGISAARHSGGSKSIERKTCFFISPKNATNSPCPLLYCSCVVGTSSEISQEGSRNSTSPLFVFPRGRVRPFWCSVVMML